MARAVWGASGIVATSPPLRVLTPGRWTAWLAPLCQAISQPPGQGVGGVPAGASPRPR